MQNLKRSQTPVFSSEVSSSLKATAQADTLKSSDFFSSAVRWNLEQDYEQRPRKRHKKDQENHRLPIKTAEGHVEQLQFRETADEERSSQADSDDNESHREEISGQANHQLPYIPIQQQIMEAKEQLAGIATLVGEDPEENVGGFRTLAEIASSNNPTIKKLGLATQMAVFKDVIPGYRIRPLEKSETTEKLSKDVRRLRSYEQTLIKSYQNYVKELSKYARLDNDDGSKAVLSVREVAISCVCALVLGVPHFNFRGELLQILVSAICGRKRDASSDKCLDTLKTLFEDDEDGTASLDAVRVLTKKIKARNFQIREEVLGTLLHLRLLSEFSFKASQTKIDKPVSNSTPFQPKNTPKSKRQFLTKRQRKVLKERKSIEKEFREADAIVGREERDKMQAETLKLIFTTYFCILKARIPQLMSAVLEGLAKYAHLINQDFFGDLLEALKDLITHSDIMLDPFSDKLSNPPVPTEEPTVNLLQISTDAGIRSSLLCITTAFALLSGQDVSRSAASLHLDLSFFIAHLYRSLHTLCLAPSLSLSNPLQPSSSTPQSTPSLLLIALTQILTPPTTSPLRLASFIKQILTIALHLPSPTPYLSLLQRVAKTHRTKIRALWHTEERKGDGLWDPYHVDLEAANVFAGTVWEGELLRLHYNPGVRDGVMALQKIVGETS